MHGDLPHISKCDVLCICGDIVPLYIQRDILACIEWMKNEFKTWCDGIKCERIFLIAGNHDFVFEHLWIEYNDTFNKSDLRWVSVGEDYKDCKTFTEFVSKILGLSDNVMFLHDSGYEYKGVTFYGTPHIPELRGWAFYQYPEVLDEYFSKIPDKLDVLLTHSPGKFVNNTGVSLENHRRPEYGSAELTKAIKNKDIKVWLCGHVHSGNHNIEEYVRDADNGDVLRTLTANVSIKNENYKVAYKPLEIIL